MPATVADPNRSLDSEQISPATIAHHTVYEKTPNLHQSHICQWGAQPYLVGPLSRLVGKPPLSPWVSAYFLPLTQVVHNTNSAIPLTEIFDRVFSDVCNSLGFEVQKQKNGDRGTIVFTATLSRVIVKMVVDGGRALQPCRYRLCTHMSCIILYPYSTYPCRGYSTHNDQHRKRHVIHILTPENTERRHSNLTNTRGYKLRPPMSSAYLLVSTPTWMKRLLSRSSNTGFCTNWCTSDEQTPRPPSSTHTQWFCSRHYLNSFAILLAVRSVRVTLSIEYSAKTRRVDLSPCMHR